MSEPSDLVSSPMHVNVPYQDAPSGRSGRLQPSLDEITPWHQHGGQLAERGEGEFSTRETVRWLIAARGADMVVLMASEILYFQADLKYTRVVWHDGSALIRKGIGQLEKVMDSRSFLRVHRSTIVNIRHVRGIKRDELGRLHVTMRDHGDTLPISKPFERFFRPF